MVIQQELMEDTVTYPGIINIQPYLKVGNNKVRIITWDDVPGNDYDLVGLESCYSTDNLQ